MIDVAIIAVDSRWSSCELDHAFIEGLIDVALESHLNQNADYEVSLLLTDDAQIRALNAEWRGKDTATNVLSFPGSETDGGHPQSQDVLGEALGGAQEEAQEEAQKEAQKEAFPPVVLGDICLAYETVTAEALARSLSLQDRTAHLIVHGLLHLLGFDHEDDESADKMEAEEDRVLEMFNIRANRD